MFVSVNLQPAGRKLRSPGVYRTVNGLIALFLCVSWTTNNYGGGGSNKNVNDVFIQPYTSNKTHLRWIRLNNLISLKKELRLLVDG